MMPFAETKKQALEMRREIKKIGRCSCFRKLKYYSGYFVSDCSFNVCKSLIKMKKESSQ